MEAYMIHLMDVVVQWSVPGRHNRDFMKNYGGRQRLHFQRGALSAFMGAKSAGSPVGNNGKGPRTK